MRIDPESLRRHYASLSDGELLHIPPEDLTELAQQIYTEEMARRGLAGEPEADEGIAVEEDAVPGEEVEADEPEDFDLEEQAEPDWLEDAACACSFQMAGMRSYGTEAATARKALHDADIPCYLIERPIDPTVGDSPLECSVMVPGALSLHAQAILDLAIFNPRYDAEMRSLFSELSDADFHELKPEIFCAGLLDRAARLKKAYLDERAKR